jgi:predicted Fe-Mo cluster-binding NifX family protein
MVDTHFGRAEWFKIYEIGDGDPRLVREVHSPPYCAWSTDFQSMTPEQFAVAVEEMRECAEEPPAHHIMSDKLAAIVEALGDCRVVATAMIGDAPREELERQGVTVHAMSAPVPDVLREMAKLY